MRAYRGIGIIAPFILNLETNWRLVITSRCVCFINKSLTLPRFEPGSSNVYSSYYADYVTAVFYGKGNVYAITCYEDTERSKGIALLFL